MKKLLPIALLLLFTNLSGCKEKDPEPERDWTTEISGTYSIYELTANGKVTTLPQYSVRGGLTFTRASANVTSMRIVITNDGQTVSDERTTVYLSTKSNVTADIYQDAARTVRVGVATDELILLDATNTDGTKTSIKARR